MLFRFSVYGRHGLTKKVGIFYQPSAAIKTSVCDTAAESDNKRDLVNFPDLVRPEYAPPTRLGFIPESWFKFFYPKTGVTGPYMLGVSLGTYLFSKEIIVYDHNFNEVVALVIALTFIQMKFGDKIANAYNKAMEESRKSLDGSQERDKNEVKMEIERTKNQAIPEEYLHEIMAAKKENIMLQMEATYRERMTKVYKKVKQRLDFLVELENIERRVVQRNLADYVVRNVMASVTPELQKSAMQSCIQDLNALAAKA